MDEFRKFFEGHAVFFGVVVPILAIVGSFAGSWAAGWMQARGGRDQAAAAREAAKIAAEAQRVAALWSIRQVQIAEFIRNARELVRVSEELRERPIDADLRRESGTALRAIALCAAEVEVTAPQDVVEAAYALSGTLRDLLDEAQDIGLTSCATDALFELCGSSDTATAGAAIEAHRALNDSTLTPEAQSSIVSMVSGLTEEQVRRLVVEVNSPVDLNQRWVEAANAVTEKLRTFVAGTREMLKSEDDVAPAVPQQRRRWRRNSTQSVTSSA
ncbi:hypothetical protein [Streptomyces gardneri]|uniref:hypothetical protein n=1 Tax=Streptomyces gardneri TaxID=66892 RepID=UPI0035D84E14